MTITDRLSEDVCSVLASAIDEALGNEVFAAGKLGEAGIVESVRVAARGHKSAVPVSPFEMDECDVLIHNHPSGNLAPSDADLHIASEAAYGGKGFYIINNRADELYAVVEPVFRSRKTLDADDIASLLEAGGALDALSEHFEERPSQIGLTKMIAETFNSDGIGIFEAGTGVGKSYAYILPSIIWALDNRERVVISTGTINLQQQLFEKDIPFAKEITGRDIKAVLLKGRQNYLCRRRLGDVTAERDLFEDETDELERIIEWAQTSSGGSRSELPFLPSEALWSRICSESDLCMGMHCSFREECFVMQVRKEAAGANLLVVNHHLLFADLEARMIGAGYEDTVVLPPFSRIIFDEAHGMESAATSFFSEYFTRFKILRQLSLLHRVRRGRISGLLIQLEALSPAAEMSQDAITAADTVRNRIEELETEAAAILESETTWRLTGTAAGRASILLDILARLRKDIAACTGIYREMLDAVPEEDQDLPVVREIKSVLRRLELTGQLCLNFCEWQEREDTVFWIEKCRISDRSSRDRAELSRTQYYRFIGTPVSIAPIMTRAVFEPFKSVVCTSATIRIGSSFSYWMERTGAAFIEQERVKSGEFPSPFPYRQNVLLALVQNIPMPDNPGFQKSVETALVSLILASGGRCLVLFTSYESLKSACEAVRRELQPLGITLLRQGDDDRTRLLEAFKEDETSVLFATDSFREGVDVPGPALSHVIMVKLPFSVPNEPVQAARSEALEREGKNPFMELSLPEAVIRFRQGFGRLMRRGSDSGVVTVLDRRVTEKRYGKIFLESLPETQIRRGTLDEITGAIEEFLF